MKRYQIAALAPIFRRPYYFEQEAELQPFGLSDEKLLNRAYTTRLWGYSNTKDKQIRKMAWFTKGKLVSVFIDHAILHNERDIL